MKIEPIKLGGTQRQHKGEIYGTVSLESSLVVQWLGLGTFTAKSQGLIPSWGIKFMQAKKKSKPQINNVRFHL